MMTCIIELIQGHVGAQVGPDPGMGEPGDLDFPGVHHDEFGAPEPDGPF